MNNEAVALVRRREDETEEIMVGNNRFSDDIWDMSDYAPTKTLARTFKKIKFSYIRNEKIKMVIKQYAYYKLGKIKPRTIAHYVSKLSTFIQYCESHNINSLRELNFELLMGYLQFMKNEKKFKTSTQYGILTVIAEIIRIGQIKGWDVTSDTFFSQYIVRELINGRNKFADTTKTKPIPTDVFDKILYFALEKERRIPTRAGIVIQSQTGLRINEVLSVQEGCLSTTSDGYTFLEVEISKTEKGEPIKHKVYANELVVKCINELSEYTKHLREKSGLKELFLVNARGIITNSKSDCWTRKRLKPFIRRWNIRDKDGNLYPLQSHQFRATFVRELIKQNVPLSHIMKQFAHVSIEMTMHYLTLQEKEVKEIYADMVLNPDSKIAGMRAAEIKKELNNEFKGKTPKEIDDIISDLAESISFNPLPNGICLYDFRRGNCADGDGCFFYNCPNYITEVKFYPILKKELDLMELEMKRLKKLGRERDWQRQYVKHTHLKRLVDELEAQKNG